MRKLPGKEDASQDEGSRIQCPSTGSPPHQWRNSSHHSTDPGVVETDSLERSVDCSIEEDVAQTEDCCERIDSGPEERPSNQPCDQTECH